MADPREVVDAARSRLDEPPQTVEVVRELPRLELHALLALALLALEARSQDLFDALLLDDHRTVGVEDDDVSLANVRSGHLDGLADHARHALLRPGHAHVARPDRKPELAELLEVAHRRIHEQRGDAATFACVARSSPTSATGLGSGIVSTSTSPGAASATAA